jgi:hypothetical protein
MSADQGKTVTPPSVSVNGNAAAGFRPQNHAAGTITVEPPRREDLQPAYAQVLQGDDPAAHGWYGSMSKFPLDISQSIRIGDANKCTS